MGDAVAFLPVILIVLVFSLLVFSIIEKPFKGITSQYSVATQLVRFIFCVLLTSVLINFMDGRAPFDLNMSDLGAVAIIYLIIVGIGFALNGAKKLVRPD